MTSRGDQIVRRTSLTDNYETPEWCTGALLRQNGRTAPRSAPVGDLYPLSLDCRDTFLDPAAGPGAIVRVLRRSLANRVIASDIRPFIDHTWPGRDFLAAVPESYGRVDHIVTNPPFSLALPFLKKSLAVASKTVNLFLRIQFLEGAERYKLFLDHPPSWVHVFSSRVALYPEGTPPDQATGASTVCYAWFVWDKTVCHDYPKIAWIPPRTVRNQITDP